MCAVRIRRLRARARMLLGFRLCCSLASDCSDSIPSIQWLGSQSLPEYGAQSSMEVHFDFV